MTSTGEFKAVYVMAFEGMTASRTLKECEVTDEAFTKNAQRSTGWLWVRSRRH